MVGWYYQLNEHELEQAPGVGDGQGSLASYSPRGPKEWDTTEQLSMHSCCCKKLYHYNYVYMLYMAVYMQR